MDSHRQQTSTRCEDLALHVCEQCRSELVQPTAWEEAETGHWRVDLRCPECEHVREGVFPQSAVDAYDERLDLGTSDLTAGYRRLIRSNLREEIDRFIGALRVDAILPEDF
jgi:hypothetical protein